MTSKLLDAIESRYTGAKVVDPFPCLQSVERNIDELRYGRTFYVYDIGIRIGYRATIPNHMLGEEEHRARKALSNHIFRQVRDEVINLQMKLSESGAIADPGIQDALAGIYKAME